MYVYKTVVDSINALFNSTLEAIKDSTSAEYVKLYESVEEMFLSDDPMKIYEKYKQFYGKFGVFTNMGGDDSKINQFFELS